MDTLSIFAAGAATGVAAVFALLGARLFWLWVHSDNRYEQAVATVRIQLGIEREVSSHRRLPSGQCVTYEHALPAGCSAPVATTTRQPEVSADGAATRRRLSTAAATGAGGAPAVSSPGTSGRPRHRAGLPS